MIDKTMKNSKDGNPKARHKSRFHLFQNEAGVSFIESLAAAGIFSIAITGLSISLVQMGKARSRLAVVNGAIALQGYVIDAISRNSSYTDSPTVRAQWQAGNETGMAFSINYVDANTNPRTVSFTPNEEKFFNKDLEPCVGGFANDGCTIKAVIDFNPFGAGTPASPRFWKAAYRIITNPNLDIPVGYFGSATDAPSTPFDVSDYRLAVPDLSNKTANVAACDPANNDVAVMGINRDSGAVTCLKRGPASNPNYVCPVGMLATKLVVVDGNQLVPDCSPSGQTVVPPTSLVTMRQFTCPGDYALQTISDPRVFDPRIPLVDGVNRPICILNAQTTGVAPIPAPVDPLATRICPRPPVAPHKYIHNLKCVVVEDPRPKGKCCTTPSCSGTMIEFDTPDTLKPTLAAGFQDATVPGNTDSVNCQVETHPFNNSEPGNYPTGPGQCVFPCPSREPPALWTGKIQLETVIVGDTPTCTYSGNTTENATTL